METESRAVNFSFRMNKQRSYHATISKLITKIKERTKKKEYFSPSNKDIVPWGRIYRVNSCSEDLGRPALFRLIRKHLKSTRREQMSTVAHFYGIYLSQWWRVKKLELTIQDLVPLSSLSFLATTRASWMLASMNSSEEPCRSKAGWSESIGHRTVRT